MAITCMVAKNVGYVWEYIVKLYLVQGCAVICYSETYWLFVACSYLYLFDAGLQMLVCTQDAKQRDVVVPSIHNVDS